MNELALIFGSMIFAVLFIAFSLWLIVQLEKATGIFSTIAGMFG